MSDYFFYDDDDEPVTVGLLQRVLADLRDEYMDILIFNEAVDRTLAKFVKSAEVGPELGRLSTLIEKDSHAAAQLDGAFSGHGTVDEPVEM